MKPASPSRSRLITGDEVRQWFGASARARLQPAHHREIADALNRMRWPGDSDIDAPNSHSTNDKNADEYWDFEATTAAAKLLLASTPLMLAHWSRVILIPKKGDGFPAIKSLHEALQTAMPYIEWPFGHYQRQRGKKRPKGWHIPAVIIANRLLKLMIEAGHPAPGITRNSVVVRVVRYALIRMNYSDSSMTTASAIAIHLARWNSKYGLGDQ